MLLLSEDVIIYTRQVSAEPIDKYISSVWINNPEIKKFQFCNQLATVEVLEEKIHMGEAQVWSVVSVIRVIKLEKGIFPIYWTALLCLTRIVRFRVMEEVLRTSCYSQLSYQQVSLLDN